MGGLGGIFEGKFQCSVTLIWNEKQKRSFKNGKNYEKDRRGV